MALIEGGGMRNDTGRGLEFELAVMNRNAALSNKAWVAARELERSAYLVLSRLEIGEPMTLKELADSFGLDVSTVNRQTATLIRQGLAERIADPDGGTARKLRPTVEGLRRFHHDRQRNIDGLASLVAEWDERDCLDLMTLLRRLNEEIEKNQGLCWPRD